MRRAAQVEEARAAGVALMVTVGTTIEQSRQMLAVARAHEGVWATAAAHPHDARDGLDGLVDLLSEPEVGRGGGPRLPLRPLAAPRPG
ncbi:MAG: hypothetical protein R2695_11630 [Acidimicrobiales bacterium]